jgi:hypothetical protein
VTRALELPRAVAWEDLDASALDPASRKVVGETWRERARQEHLAVGAFALLARELAEEGCDSIVLALVTKAAWDEVRHEVVCRKMAVGLLGDGAVPPRWRGVPKVPAHDGVAGKTRVLLHMVEMCCLSETITGVFFTEMLARATNPVARAAIASLLEDELDHGRVGWAYLGERKRDGALDGLAEALPAMLDRTIGRALAPREGGREDPAMEAFGFLGNDTSRAMILRALHDVILPGFETVGVDTGAAVGMVRERGW